MFDRLQKPFLTVETGEAYQPIRLTYQIFDKAALLGLLRRMDCLVAHAGETTWDWLWTAECASLQFESVESFSRNSDGMTRLGKLAIDSDKLFINMPSFKRACLAAPFFHKIFSPAVALIQYADFINKVFALDERLPHGFTELFNEADLDQILQQRQHDFDKVQQQCEQAPSAAEAFAVLANYSNSEAHKRLPFAERYRFELNGEHEPDIIFLSFYVFLRGRELVAINRWFGDAGYTLANAADETIEQVFGGMDLEAIE